MGGQGKAVPYLRQSFTVTWLANLRTPTQMYPNCWHSRFCANPCLTSLKVTAFLKGAQSEVIRAI